jgi:hypothetical protein
MFVIPVAFSMEYKNMLAHRKEMLEYHNGQVAIHPRFNKLITALRTAVEKGEGSLDKDATSFDDCFDAFRLSMQFWHLLHYFLGLSTISAEVKVVDRKSP